MRLSGTYARSISSSRGLGNQLWDLAGNRPSLDLRFADDKSLVDATTGSNLVDFTRASSGTYVGSDGLIKTAVTNLLLQSEDFSTTWGLANMRAFGSGSTVNAVIAPDGTLTADHIVEDTSTGNHNISQTVAVVSGSAYSIFIYAKAPAQPRQLQILVANTNFTVTPQAIFDASTGSVVSSAAGTASIVPFGNGWYRCQLTTIPATSSGINGFNFRFYDGATNSYTGDDTSGLYLWGAQLEQSDTVGEYVKTTSTINSAPRFDHDPVTGECLGLLVEESSANLIPFSEDFGQSAWTKETGVSAVGNQITFPAAPDFSASVGIPGGRIYDVISVTASTTVTATLIVPSSSSWSDPTAQIKFGIFTDYADSIVSPQPYIQFVRITATDNGSGSFAFAMKSSKALTISGLRVQIEEKSFGTSYIPTEGSAVTRAADVASISGSNFSSWYNQSEGTVFYEGQVLGSDQLSNKDMLGLSDGTSNEFAKMFIPSGNNQRFRVEVGGVTQVLQNAILTADVYSPAKSAFALKLNSTTCAGNGIVQPEFTSCLIPAVDRFVFGALSTGESELAARYKRITYWPTRLGDEVLQTITQ